MRLHDAALHFNNMPCNDGYSGAFLYNGQLVLYDDSRRDSESTERRILELDPALAARCENPADSHWL